MSTHPNVILKCTIKVPGTTRSMLRFLLAQNREEIPDEALPFWLNSRGEIIKKLDGSSSRISRDDDQIAIGNDVYHTLVMETGYDESMQIAGKEGDLILYDLVTYGYGKEVAWSDLQSRVDSLEKWAAQPQRNLDCRISISANYW